MKILMIEDEQRAGEKLQDLIKKHTGKIQSLNWLRSVEDTIAYLTSGHNPDLIFSDIELLDGNAFEIYKQIPLKCPIIFCTAYNQFYLDAFKTNGIAYLLKPYTEDEFKEALAKHRTLFQSKQTTALQPELLHQLQELLNPPKKKYKQTFTVKKATGVYLLNTKEITYFQAQGDFILAHDFSGNKHILNYSLTAIEGMIDPGQFFRINRSEIVNFDAIVKYYAYIKNRLEIYLKEDKTTLYTSNSRTSDFRSWVESK